MTELAMVLVLVIFVAPIVVMVGIHNQVFEEEEDKNPDYGYLKWHNSTNSRKKRK